MASLVRQPQNRRIKKRYSDGAAVMLDYYIFLILSYFLDFWICFIHNFYFAPIFSL